MIKKYWEKHKKLRDLLKHERNATGVIKKIFLWLIFIGIGAGLLGLIAIVGMITILSIGLPDVTDIDKLSVAQSTEIFDRDGDLLYTIHGDENREVISYNQLPQFFIDAVVAAEDADFWEHNGYDARAILRAGLHELFGIGAVSGGSTITQQYVKNAFLTSEHTYTRKIKEVILAIRLEKEFDKEKIFELYVNKISYGGNLSGVQKAAQIYFHKDVSEVTKAESVILASIPNRPAHYSPYGATLYSSLEKSFPEDEDKITTVYDLNKEDFDMGLIGQYVTIGKNEVYLPGRCDIILKSMYNTGKITAEERKQVVNDLQEIKFQQKTAEFKHPHFVMYIQQMLEDRYGKDVVRRGGLKVYTTLDSELQTFAEDVAKEQGEKNEEKFNANNVAILTINANTGQILAMVGSRDYNNDDIDGKVNVVFRPRQPGSSFKPFVFAAAFYNGYAPGNVVYDVPMAIGRAKPSNYDGGWGGQMTLRKALGQSRNIPAIKAYYLAKGQDAIIDFVTKLGITTLNKEHDYGYPLALGAGEIPLSEMVTAYGTFANGGKKPELVSILKVENANGDILEEYKQKEFDEVMLPEIAYMINSILSDQSVAVGPLLFVNGKINAAKTGTATKANKQNAKADALPGDAWVIGYSPSIVTGVWTGNTNGTAMKWNANGYDTAGPIFNKVMTKALKNEKNKEFPEPDNIVRYEISKFSGKLISKDTPNNAKVTEIFAKFAVPTEKDDSFKRVKIDKVSGNLATEYTPEDAVVEVLYQNYSPITDHVPNMPTMDWRAEILKYYRNKTGDDSGVKIGLPPTQYDTVHTAKTANSAPSIIITSPSQNGRVKHGSINIVVSVDAPNNVKEVQYFIDNTDIAYRTSDAPYNARLNISKFLPNGSVHTITAKVIDELGYSNTSSVEVKIDDNYIENGNSGVSDKTNDIVEL